MGMLLCTSVRVYCVSSSEHVSDRVCVCVCGIISVESHAQQQEQEQEDM